MTTGTAVPGTAVPLSFTAEERQQYIGASDVAAIMGLNPWKTRRDLWLEKKGLSAPNGQNVVMKLGVWLEPFIVQQLKEQKDITLTQYPGLTYAHPEHDFLRAHPDGIIDVPVKEATGVIRTVVELKAVGDSVWETCVRDGIPAYYMPQVLTQALCANAHKVLFVAMHRETGKLHTFAFDLTDTHYAMMDSIVVEAQRFWSDVAKDEYPSEVVVPLMTVEGKRSNMSAEDIAEYARLAPLWATVHESLQTLEQQESKLRDELRALLERSDTTAHEAAGVRATLQMQTRRSLDVTRTLTTVCPECLKKLTGSVLKETPYARFQLRETDA